MPRSHVPPSALAGRQAVNRWARHHRACLYWRGRRRSSRRLAGSSTRPLGLRNEMLLLGACLFLASPQIVTQRFGETFLSGDTRGAFLRCGRRRLAHPPMQCEGICAVKPRLLLDPNFCVRRKDHRHGPLRRVLGRLIRVRAPPRADAGAIAFDGGASGAARRFESPEHRFSGSICRRIDPGYRPSHEANQPRHRRKMAVPPSEQVRAVRQPSALTVPS